MALGTETPGAQPSSSKLVPGPSPYQESSQFRHWRFSPGQLANLRQQLNAKSVEVAARNAELEKEAQISLGHAFTDPPPAATYLSTDDELLLLRHYCSQAAKIVRDGFQLPESVESTAASYLKRFYLKNSVMEWHPKVIMPTCVYLAAKTTNYPISMRHFQEKFTRLNPQEILDHEFLVAQSLAFEFWVRGPDKALRGWVLDFQSQPGADAKIIQATVPSAINHLAHSRLTDAEFIYTPSQISLACLRLANPTLVDSFLDWRYSQVSTSESGSSASTSTLPYGLSKDLLHSILSSVETLVKDGSAELDLKKIKGVDKRLKSCTNPEKVPGTALYIKRKQEQEAAAAEVKAEKTLKIKREMSDAEMVFGDIIQPKIAKKDKRPMSPRVSLAADRDISRSGPVETGMGVKDEAMGLIEGGAGLKDVGKTKEVS